MKNRYMCVLLFVLSVSLGIVACADEYHSVSEEFLFEEQVSNDNTDTNSDVHEDIYAQVDWNDIPLNEYPLSNGDQFMLIAE